MGLFDTFYGKVKCPNCNETHYFQDQTKSFDCLMETLMLGDYIDKGNANYIYVAEGFCPIKKTDFNVNVVLRRGQIVNFLNDDEVKNINITKLENIEEGLGKKQLYLEECKIGLGLAQEKSIYQENNYLKIGDCIVALNNEWKIEEIYIEILDESRKDEKSYNFCKCVYKDAYVYKVNGNLGKRYIRVDKNSMEVILEEKFEPQIGCVLQNIGR